MNIHLRNTWGVFLWVHFALKFCDTNTVVSASTTPPRIPDNEEVIKYECGNQVLMPYKMLYADKYLTDKKIRSFLLFQGNTGPHVNKPSVYLNPGSAWTRILLCRWKKKYQQWHSPGAHCIKNDFKIGTQFIFTSWGCPKIQVSLVHLLCVSIYLLKWNDHVFVILYTPGVKLKVTLNCLHSMKFSRYLGSWELIYFSDNF